MYLQILSAFYPVRIDCLLNGFAQPSEEGEQKMEVEEVRWITVVSTETWLK